MTRLRACGKPHDGLCGSEPYGICDDCGRAVLLKRRPDMTVTGSVRDVVAAIIEMASGALAAGVCPTCGQRRETAT